MIINDLPPEILGEIFVMANMSVRLGHRYHKWYIVRTSHKWAPLSLVHVCRYWREIALSMQTLWTSFDVTQFKPEALPHWLSFARSSPLHLSYWPRDGMEWGKPVEEKVLKKSTELLRRFSSCADRWDSLYFRSRNFELTEAIANMLTATASRSPLQKFEICMAHDDTPPNVIDTLCLAISLFPSLRHLSWTFNSLQITLSPVLPWHALEDVYICSCLEVEDFIWCLTQCTSARNVAFLGVGRGKKQRVANSFLDVQCVRPRVESLTLNEHSDPYTFLQHFTLPSLVSLEIQTVHGPANRLQDFLVRSQPPLQIFTLEVDQMKKEDVIGCLLTPYLRSVPDVSAKFLFVDTGPYLGDIVRMRPDILKKLPRLRAWLDMEGYYIGWTRNSV